MRNQTHTLPSGYGRVAVLVALALAGLAAALLPSYPAPEIGRQAIERLAADAGLEIATQEIRLSPLRGLFLEDVELSGNLASSHFAGRAQGLRLTHQPLYLLLGRAVLRRASLAAPVVEVTPATKRESAPDNPGGSKQRGKRPDDETADSGSSSSTPGRLRVEIDLAAIQLTDARIRIVAEGAPDQTVEIDGATLDLELEGTADPEETPAWPRGAGHMNAASITAGTFQGTDLRAEVAFEPETIALEELTFEHPLGRVVVPSLVVDPRSPYPAFRLDLRLEDFDLQPLIDAPAGGGMGPAEMTVSAKGRAFRPRSLRGAGRLRLTAGTVPAAPVFADIDRALPKGTLVGAAYDEIEIPFQLEGRRIRLDAAVLELGAAGSLTVTGWISRDGPVTLEAELLVPWSTLGLEGPADSSEPDGGDAATAPAGIPVPLQVTGTLAEPHVAAQLPDLDRETRRQLEEALKAKLKEVLSGLAGDG